MFFVVQTYKIKQTTRNFVLVWIIYLYCKISIERSNQESLLKYCM